MTHLACFLGDLEILKILNEKYKVDFNQTTRTGKLTGLHCAAQRKEGIVSIYYLKDNFAGFDPNMMDANGATPLHYAIMSIEESNIEAMLSLGSDINQKDKQGDTSLHLALVRYVDDQENYGVYKEIIKLLLQFGASRDLRNNKG